MSVIKSNQQLYKEDLSPIISLINKHIDCFLYGEKRTIDQIGKISLYKLIEIGPTTFLNQYATGELREEEDIETGEVYAEPVKMSYDYNLLQEGKLIQQWENYDSFREHQKTYDSK